MGKYPFVRQEEFKDCGVACLEMVIKYYKGYKSRNTLLEMTKTNKDGTTAYHLKEALINLGFEAKGISCKLSDINSSNIILPCIANVVINDSYKHFVVIYEINFKYGYLVIGDPNDKIKKIKYTDFDKIFNNVLVTFYPIRKLEIDTKISYKSFILELLKPNKKMLINIFILSIFITIFSIFTSFYTEYMIKGVSTYSKMHILFIFSIFFSTYLLKIISDFFRNKLLSYINQKLDIKLTLGIFKNIIKLPYYYYKNRTTGDIVSRINDLDNIRDMINKVAITLYVDLPLTFISLIILYLLNQTLFLIGLIILVLYFIIIFIFKEIFNDHIKKAHQKRSEVTSYLVESISGFETIKGINIGNNILNKFEKKYVRFLKEIFNYNNLYFIQKLFKDLINDIGFIFIMFSGCILVIEGKMEIEKLFTFSALLIYFLDPIKNIIDLDSTIKEAKNSFIRVVELQKEEDKEIGILDKFKNGDIIFKNLNFSFDDRRIILKNINLKIKKSSKTMIVGKSGSGKSTLFKLLMRYYKIGYDNIFIDSIDINNYKENVIRDNILYISQNEVLFNDTIYNNLIFEGSNSSNLLNVSKMCYLDEIMDNNLGFNTLIEENGFNLSGGEKARIVLARALLRNFKILIIDEGLSEVDINLERKILKNIFNYYKDKTIIVVSHRLDNLDLFDNLIELEDGNIKKVECKNE